MIVGVEVRVMTDDGETLALSTATEMVIQVSDVEQNVLAVSAKVDDFTRGGRDAVLAQLKEIEAIQVPLSEQAEQPGRARPFGRRP